MISENTYPGTKLLYKNEIATLSYVYKYRKNKQDDAQYFASIKLNGALLDVPLADLDYLKNDD